MSYYKGTIQKETFQTVDDVLRDCKLCAKGIPERGIRKETTDHYEVREEYSEVEGKVIAHYFPVHKNNRLTGFIKRKVGAPKKIAFSSVGDVSVENELLGQNKCTHSKKLFCAEGIYDYLSVWQVLRFSDFNKGKTNPIIPNVVSIVLGTNNALDNISNNLEFISNYKEFITVFDSDYATDEQLKKRELKGQDAVSEVALVVPNLKNVKLSLNDPNEYLKEGKADELYKSVTFDAKEFEADNIVEGGIGVDKLLEPLRRGVYVDCLPGTMRILHGLREREMTIVLAPTGVGKTSVCKEIGYSLVKQGRRVGHIFLEEDLKKTQQSYIAMDNGVFLPKFRENPGIIAKDRVVESYNNLIENGRTMWMNHFGSLNSATLINKFRWMAVKKIEYVILDHISMVISGQESSNERKDIDLLMTELAAFTTATGVHPIVVSHIKRVNQVLPKGKDGRVEYPYWEPVDETMARGSSAFEALGWNIIVIEPERLESKERGRIRTRIAKNREWGWLGIGDVLEMHPHTGRLRVVE